MCVDHGCIDIFVPQQLLNDPDIVSRFEHVCGKTVAQGVTARHLRQISFSHRFFYGTLYKGGVNMPAHDPAASGINRELACRKYPLPL